MTTSLKRGDFSVGWICALPIEFAAARAVVEDFEVPPDIEVAEGDNNIYKYGRIGKHNVAITCLSHYGVIKAAIAASHMRSTFNKLRFWLMVGIGGGIPSASNDIRLGDIVFGWPTAASGGVIQYDFGKATEDGFQRVGSLNAPPSVLMAAVASLKANAALCQRISDATQEIETKNIAFQYPGQDADILYPADYRHVPSRGRQAETCNACDASKAIERDARDEDYAYVHYGIIASGSSVVKDGNMRDKIGADHGALCFEMEAAGLVNDFPCLVVRGICDYSDGHKNKLWQPYAALIAAVYAKELLYEIPIIRKEIQEQRSHEKPKIEHINVVIPFDVPLPRNPTFVGRIHELEKIHNFFSRSNSVPSSVPKIFALTGTGGMGKTQTALEYAYSYNIEYTAVFWLSGFTEDSLSTSYINIMQKLVEEQARVSWPESLPDYSVVAAKLGIPGLIGNDGKVSAAPERAEAIKSAVFRWLQLPRNKWLLIFDNMDDLESYDVQKYFPRLGGGHILVTSRRPEFSTIAEQADLDELSSEEAVDLLLKLADLTGSREAIEAEAAKVVKKLGHMPLAISHAGCYIRQTKASLGDYLESYEKSFMTVQSKKPAVGWNYRDDTVATTWEISFSKIKQKNERAASLLLAASFLNPQEIFEDMWGEEDKDFAIPSLLQLKESVLLLASYSLVKIIRSGVFTIHPVVHSWAREHQTPYQQASNMTACLILLYRTFDKDELQISSKKFLPAEAKRMVLQIKHISLYLMDMGVQGVIGNFAIEEPSIEVLKSVFAAIHYLAKVIWNNGAWNEALLWLEQNLNALESILGKDHLYRIYVLSEVGNCLQNMGRFAEAMEKTTQALDLATKRAVIDEQSRRMVWDLKLNMADCLSYQQRYEESLALLEDLRTDVEQDFNRSAYLYRVDFFMFMMADCLSNVGQIDEALEWYDRSVTYLGGFLGADHPITLERCCQRAFVLRMKGCYDEALQEVERVLAKYQQNPDGNDDGIAGTIHQIADIADLQGDYSKAMELYEKTIVGMENTYGPDHLQTLKTIHNFGACMTRQGKYEEALQLYNRVLAGYQKYPGDNTFALDTLNNITVVLFKQGKYEEAMQLCPKLLLELQEKLPSGHKTTIDAADTIVGILTETTQSSYTDEALQCYEQALAIASKHDVTEHELIIEAAHKLAEIYEEQGKEGESMRWRLWCTEFKEGVPEGRLEAHDTEPTPVEHEQRTDDVEVEGAVLDGIPEAHDIEPTPVDHGQRADNALPNHNIPEQQSNPRKRKR